MSIIMEEDEMANLPLTLITHFYNEEYLLPFWIEWHKKLSVDTVVFIDYNSTDKSVEIIKELAPDHWQIRSSKNAKFDAFEVDQEVQHIEQEFMGWKLVLNTTEFLMLPQSAPELDYSTETKAISCSSSIIVGPGLTQDPKSLKEFISGFNEGYLTDPKTPLDIEDGGTNSIIRSNRFIHNHTHGEYHIGRHGTRITPCLPSNSIYVAWVGYYPWNIVTINRKLQIKNKIPAEDKRKRRGYQHLWCEQYLSEIRKSLVEGNMDLCTINEYMKTYQHCLKII